MRVLECSATKAGRHGAVRVLHRFPAIWASNGAEQPSNRVHRHEVCAACKAGSTRGSAGASAVERSASLTPNVGLRADGVVDGRQCRADTCVGVSRAVIAAWGLRRFGRGLVLTGVAVFLQFAGVACGGSDDRDGPILGSELKTLPAIAVVAGDPRDTGAAHAGNVFLTSGDRRTLTLLKSWPGYTDVKREEEEPYGVFNAHWSPDREQLGVSLATWCGDPCSQLALHTGTTTIAPSAELPQPGGDSVTSWSADGRRLLYEKLFAGRSCNLGRFEPHRGLGDSASIDARPESFLSAAGWGLQALTRRLVNRRLRPGRRHLGAWISPVGAVRRITTGSDDWFVSWSPDSPLNPVPPITTLRRRH